MDDIELDPQDVTDLLDSIEGAYERTNEGREQAERGEVVPIEDLA